MSLNCLVYEHDRQDMSLVKAFEEVTGNWDQFVASSSKLTDQVNQYIEKNAKRKKVIE
jgi:hypothetical protein